MKHAHIPRLRRQSSTVRSPSSGVPRHTRPDMHPDLTCDRPKPPTRHPARQLRPHPWHGCTGLRHALRAHRSRPRRNRIRRPIGWPRATLPATATRGAAPRLATGCATPRPAAAPTAPAGSPHRPSYHVIQGGVVTRRYRRQQTRIGRAPTPPPARTGRWMHVSDPTSLPRSGDRLNPPITPAHGDEQRP